MWQISKKQVSLLRWLIQKSVIERNIAFVIIYMITTIGVQV
ncbi:MAG: hypothetical protein ACFB0B_06305 [Thermonemataceae bacterium]